MPVLEAKAHAFYLDGAPYFLYAGEIHYFRIDPEQWLERLLAAKALGVTMISTYVPWIWHEPQPGCFDFQGTTHPRRNVVRFIELARDQGLLIFMRPGPYVMAELAQHGLPHWLAERHPEVVAQDQDGRPHATGMVTYLHPTFLTLTHAWYRAVAHALGPYFSSRGGPIVMTQLDNEVGMLHWVSAMPDHSAETIAAYQEFLDRNQVSDTYWQQGRFWRAYRAAYLARLKAMGTDLGFPRPYVINVHGFKDFSVYSRGVEYPTGLSQLSDAATHGDLLGGDFYPGNVTYDTFHDLSLAVTYTQALNPPEAPSFSPEFQAGRFQDRPLLAPSDLDLAARVAVAYGLNGLSWYMLSGGDNPDHIGLFGFRHDWQAPIGPDGSRRPSAAVVQHLGRLIKTFGHTLAQTRSVVEVHLGWYSPYYMTENPVGGETPTAAARREIATEREAWHFDGIHRVLVRSNIGIGTVTVDGANPIAPEIPLLWMATTRYLDQDTQSRLADYVVAGGTLILGPRVPDRDLNGNPCDVLSRRLHLPRVMGYRERTLADILDVRSVYGAACAVLETLPDAEVLGWLHADQEQAVIVRLPAGRGQVVLFGLGFTDVYRYYATVVRRVLAAIGFHPAIASSNPTLQVVRRESVGSANHGFLFVHNFHDTPQTTVISMDSQPADTPWRLTLAPRQGLLLPYAGVPLSHGVEVMMTTVELSFDDDLLTLYRGIYPGSATLRQRGRGPRFRFSLVSGDATVHRENPETDDDGTLVTIAWPSSRESAPIQLRMEVEPLNPHARPSGHGVPSLSSD